jgi:hypothetical protein
MRFRYRAAAVAVLVTAIALPGYGGGGSSGTGAPVAPTLAFNPQIAEQKHAMNGDPSTNWTVTGTRSGAATTRLAPATPAVFEGVQDYSDVLTLTNDLAAVDTAICEYCGIVAQLEAV